MSNQKVTIGCKLPNGILLSANIDGKLVEHRLCGWSSSNILGSNCGFTDDVPKDLWDEWVKNFKEHRLVKNGLVFAQSSNSKAKSEAKEKESEKSGKEQLDKPKGKLQTADKA